MFKTSCRAFSFFQLCICLVSLIACSDGEKKAPELTANDQYRKAKRLMLAHRYAEAESEFKAVLPAFAKSKDDELEYIDSQSRLALACSLQGRLDDAASHIEPVLQYLKRIHLTEEQSELLVVLDELCEQFLLHATPGSPQEEDFLKKSLAFDLLCHRGNHTRLVEIWSRLAICHIARGHEEQAKQCIDKAVNLTFGPDHHDFANNMISVLQIHVAYNKAHKHKEADDFLQLIIKKTDPFFSHASKTLVYDRLGSAYAKFGNISESIKYYERSLSIQQKLGHDGRTRSRTMQKLAIAYEATGNQTKADALLRAGISILSASEAKNSRFLFEANECYANYLSRQKRFAEAKVWKSKAQDGIRELIPE